MGWGLCVCVCVGGGWGVEKEPTSSFPHGAHTNAYRSKLDLTIKRLNVNV